MYYGGRYAAKDRRKDMTREIRRNNQAYYICEACDFAYTEEK
jgi:ribosomal protein L37AE/L43A